MPHINLLRTKTLLFEVNSETVRFRNILCIFKLSDPLPFSWLYPYPGCDTGLPVC